MLVRLSRFHRRHRHFLGCLALCVFLLPALFLASQVALAAGPPDQTAEAGRPQGVMIPSQNTCAATPTFANCNGADPLQSLCAADAISLEQVPALVQDRPIGETDLRYSAHCHSSWVRSLLYASATALVARVWAIIPFSATSAPEAVQNSQRAADGSLSVYSDMAFGERPSGTPTTFGGQFDLIGNTPLTVSL